MKIQTAIKGYKPLYSGESGVFLYRKGKLYRWYDGELCEWMRLFPRSWKDCCRLSIRLFHREPRLAVAIGENLLLLSVFHAVYLVDTKNRSVSKVYEAEDGFSAPLNILPTKGKWLAVWGDYGQNPNRKAVRIYGLKSDYSTEIIYTFHSGQIRHIHNIIPKKNGGFYIFTGDCEPTAGIYEADDSFSCVLQVALGAQKYRTVVGMNYPQGLVYATDAANEQNYLYLLDGKRQRVIAKLNGSCIYGRRWRDGLLLSTTVEPDESVRGIRSFLSRKRGKGILSDEVEMLYLDKALRLRRVGVFTKDVWPIKLMQYGCVQFASGKDLWIYPVGVKEQEGTAIRCELEE